jgi:uncharacterized protein (TIGR02001 family)
MLYNNTMTHSHFTKGNTNMKKLLLALMMVAGITVAQAQVTGNLGLTSDYRFRGISQTQNAPAVQGGIDYTHASGLYVGNWNSSVSSSMYTNGAGIESDVYAGFKKEIFGKFVLDVGTYNYLYPRATTAGTGSNFDTYEGYAGLGYGPVSVKYSRTLGNGYFGTTNARGTGYYEANVAYPVTQKISLLAHAGHTNVANSTNLDYTDYNFGVGYDLEGWNIAAKYYTNTAETSSFKTANTINGQKLYKNAAVVSVSKSF